MGGRVLNRAFAHRGGYNAVNWSLCVVEPNALLSRIEAAGMWAYFHKDWLLEIRNDLRPQLPENYQVFVESEAVLVSPDTPSTIQTFLPDVSVSRDRDADRATSAEIGTAAVIEVEEPWEISSRYSLVIRRAPHHEVVAAVELLSPSNKGLGNRFDKEKYLHKRESLLEAGVNLLEVDALLHGDRLLPTSLADLSRYERNAWTARFAAATRKTRGWGWNPGEPLPAISWHIERDLMVGVDLGRSFEKASAFNQWESIVGQE
jgi:hypothetical protein